jgi:hypothetical protein
MGCDINSFAEVKRNNKWEKVNDHFTLDDNNKKFYNKEKGDNPFYWRSYSTFAFLAGVRNYEHCEPISEPKGLPDDLSEEVKNNYEDLKCDTYSASYLTAKELLDFDYDKTLLDRRVTKTKGNYANGAALEEEGEGRILTYRENLGEWFFKHLEELKTLGEPENVRIVFWFNN